VARRQGRASRWVESEPAPSWWTPGLGSEEGTLTISEKGGHHRTIGIHFAAAEAISEYIRKTGLATGPLFRARRAPRTDELGDNTKDPRYRLIETLSALVEAYDDEHHEVPDVSGVEMLRYLMEEQNLKQTDLSADLGSQSVESEVLSGKRELNVRQICRLAERFHVAPAAFLPRLQERS